MTAIGFFSIVSLTLPLLHRISSGRSFHSFRRARCSHPHTKSIANTTRPKWCMDSKQRGHLVSW